MSSCGAGGLFVISVHRLLKSQRFGRDSRFVLNKVFGALAANLGSGSADGGLSSVAVCVLLLMIAPKLEEFASGVLAKETAAAKERRKLREERPGAPPAGGKKK